MSPIRCELCGRSLEPHGRYIVRIEVFADPSVPAMSLDELATGEAGETIAALLDQMKNLSADDLQDQVHRRFEFTICPVCQRQVLANPLGKPRQTGTSRN